jgi:hypothetical protein
MNRSVDVDKECGLFLSRDNARFAASPDALVSCKCCGNGLLEIKCTSAHRDMTVEEIAQLRNYHFKADKDGRPVLKPRSSWCHQVQAQLFIYKQEWCDFVLFTMNGPPSVERVYADSDWVKTTIP